MISDLLSFFECVGGAFHTSETFSHHWPLTSTWLNFPGARNLALLMSQGFTEAESRWALVIVDTRAFTFQSGKEQECLALVPLLDLFNNRHSGRFVKQTHTERKCGFWL